MGLPKTRRRKVWCDAKGLAPLDPSAKRKRVRCPECGTRFLPAYGYCVGGEWVGWIIPPHKYRTKKSNESSP